MIESSEAERWARVQSLFHAALDRPAPERAAWVAASAAHDPTLAARVMALLQADERPLSILSASPSELAASVGRAGEHTVAPEASANAAPVSLAAGARVGRFVVVREVGRGGMGAVYLARDERNGDEIALKILQPRVAMALAPERFQREIRLASRMRHAHLLPVLDSGDDGGSLWLTMPYVDGETLRARLLREERLSIPDALRIAAEIAAALAYVHDLGIVHRDVKPENVLLARDGASVLADFGIARAVDAAETDPVTAVGALIGTPVYMSPEQAGGERVDGRTDVYALGCVLHELLAGVPPFAGDPMRALRARWLAQPAPSIRTARPEVPAGVDGWLCRALDPVRVKRPTSLVLADALRDLARAVPHASGAPSPVAAR